MSVNQTPLLIWIATGAIVSRSSTLYAFLMTAGLRRRIAGERWLAVAVVWTSLFLSGSARAFDFPPERVQATPTPLNTPSDPLGVGPSKLLQEERIQKELALTAQQVVQVNAAATQFDDEIARLKQERAKHPADDKEAAARFQQEAQAATKRFRSGITAVLTDQQLDVLKRILLRENGSLGW